MSLTTLVPIGSKTKSISVLPSESGFILCTGSWDEVVNSINVFSISFDRAVMDESPNLDSSKFSVKHLKTIGDIQGDINSMQIIDGNELIYGTSLGEAKRIQMNGNGLVLSQHESPCVSIDYLDGKILAVHEDGYIYNSSTRLGFACTQGKWLNQNEFLVATSNSKVIHLDGRSNNAFLVSHRRIQTRPLSILCLDINRDVSDRIFCTGDDEGSVSLWDLRNPYQPVAQDNTNCSPGTA